MISKAYCLYIYLLLYGGTILALFVRALFRRRLLDDYGSLHGVPHADQGESLPRRLLLAVPRQISTLRKLGKSLDATPAPVRRRYRRFQVFTWIAVVLLVLLIVFSFTAHRICGA